jgi:hypothetical protein
MTGALPGRLAGARSGATEHRPQRSPSSIATEGTKMVDEPSMPKDIPAGDRDRQREIADRAGAKDPTIEINKKKEEEQDRDQDRPAQR